jgi:hypothetical protein
MNKNRMLRIAPTGRKSTFERSPGAFRLANIVLRLRRETAEEKYFYHSFDNRSKKMD